LTRKYENLKEIKKAITYLKQELSFSVSEISFLSKCMAENTKGEISHILGDVHTFLSEDKTLDFKDAWYKSKGDKSLFTFEAEKIVDSLFKDLGKRTLDIELENITKAEKRLEILESEEKEKYKKDKKLIYTLGVTACAVMLIVAI